MQCETSGFPTVRIFVSPSNPQTNVRTPTFFLVGAPKCGTTSFDRYLAAHPDVFMAPKEPHYFAFDMPDRGLHVPVRETRKRTYLQRFRDARREAVVGETSPWYLYSEVAADEIHQFCADARILCILRNPVSMIASLHQMNVANVTETELALADALALEQARLRGECIPETTELVWDLHYTNAVRYHTQIERYRSRFGAERVKIVIFEDMVANPAAVYEDVLRFLDVDPSFRPEFSVANAARPVQNLGLRRFLKTTSLRFIPHVIEWIPNRLRKTGGRLLARLGSSPGHRRTVTEDALQHILSVIDPEITALEHLLDRDLRSLWGLPPAGAPAADHVRFGELEETDG